MASKPVVNKEVDRLYTIPGSVPNPVNMPDYCYFKDRCNRRMPVCDGVYPKEVYVTPTHMVTCYHYFDEQAEE
jgi:peptide/nickel transport system ATP-binding protein